jgi:hypothetical protein
LSITIYSQIYPKYPVKQADNIHLLQQLIKILILSQINIHKPSVAATDKKGCNQMDAARISYRGAGG